MKTIKELGALTKQKYPTVYDHLEDEEVGRRLKSKYPASYSAYVDVQFTEKVQNLLDYYNPKKGRFTSWWQRGKADSRSDLLQALNQEQRLFLEQAAMFEEAVLKGEASAAAHQTFLANNQYFLIELQAKAHLLGAAIENGLTLEYDQALKYERAQSEVRISEHERMTQIDLNRQFEESREAVRLGILASAMSEHQKLFLVQELVDLSYKQIHDIQQGELPEALKVRMIADREEIIATLKEDSRVRQTRLLSVNNGEEV